MQEINLTKKPPIRSKMVMVRITEREHSFLQKVARDTNTSISTVAYNFMMGTLTAAYQFGYNGKQGAGKPFN